MHSPPLGPDEPGLQVQEAKAELPVDEFEFSGHARQVDDAVGLTAVEYFPAPQCLQIVDPVDTLYFPAKHAVQAPPSGPVEPALQVQLVEAELPTGEMESCGQALHVELAEAPTGVEYFPASQSVHASDPVEVLYFPATHAVHVFPSGPVVEYFPASQSVHASDPVEVLYFPATHAVHVPPSGPVDPALQVQAVLPAGELEFDGQALHVELAEAPSGVEYFPASQSMHASDPVEALYLPATHAVHVPPSGPVDPALQVQLVEAELPTGEMES